MTVAKATDGYGAVAIGPHWLTLLILIAVCTCINLTGVLFQRK